MRNWIETTIRYVSRKQIGAGMNFSAIVNIFAIGLAMIGLVIAISGVGAFIGWGALYISFLLMIIFWVNIWIYVHIDKEHPKIVLGMNAKSLLPKISGFYFGSSPIIAMGGIVPVMPEISDEYPGPIMIVLSVLFFSFACIIFFYFFAALLNFILRNIR